jgi:hypothetical protein
MNPAGWSFMIALVVALLNAFTTEAVIAFRADERVGAGFQADDTFKCFLTKFLEGCKDGGQCEDHDH